VRLERRSSRWKKSAMTDYPFRDRAEVNRDIADWEFSAADLRAIERENALMLLPRVKSG
jgi:hypothetical protein